MRWTRSVILADAAMLLQCAKCRLGIDGTDVCPSTPGAALHHVSCLIQHARSVSRTHVTVNVTLACIRRTESKKKKQVSESDSE